MQLNFYHCKSSSDKIIRTMHAQAAQAMSKQNAPSFSAGLDTAAALLITLPSPFRVNVGMTLHQVSCCHIVLR